MIKGVMYSQGKLKNLDARSLRVGKELVWIYSSESSLKELQTISHLTHVPLFELKHSLDPREKPRIANKDGYSVLIFRALRSRDLSNKDTFPIEFIAGKRFLIMLTPEKNETLDALFRDTDASSWKAAQKDGFGVFIFRTLLRLLRDYETFLEYADDVIDELEEAAMEYDEKQLKKLLNLKRELVFLRRSLLVNKDMVNGIAIEPPLHVVLNDWYQELLTEYAQVSSTEELIQDRVTSVTYMFLSSSNNALNRTVKNLTVIATVFLVPMLITSMYGMNLILPLGKHPDGFLIINAINVFFMLLMYLFFRMKKWL